LVFDIQNAVFSSDLKRDRLAGTVMVLLGLRLILMLGIRKL
jgi:hypothetical protein